MAQHCCKHYFLYCRKEIKTVSTAFKVPSRLLTVKETQKINEPQRYLGRKIFFLRD